MVTLVIPIGKHLQMIDVYMMVREQGSADLLLKVCGFFAATGTI